MWCLERSTDKKFLFVAYFPSPASGRRDSIVKYEEFSNIFLNIKMIEMMTMNLKTNLLSTAVKEEIDHWLQKYPVDQRQSALLSALMLAQEENKGWLTTDLMDAVADYLQIPRIVAYEVANFYSLYDLEPVGKNKIYLCNNISCMLRGSEQIAKHLQNRLQIDFEQTTKDGKFTLKHAECLAACAGAPMMQVNKTYYENLTPEKVDEILAQYE
jgi:NADH-quinone oxidoreductase subunit E